MHTSALSAEQRTQQVLNAWNQWYTESKILELNTPAVQPAYEALEKEVSASIQSKLDDGEIDPLAITGMPVEQKIWTLSEKVEALTLDGLQHQILRRELARLRTRQITRL